MDHFALPGNDLARVQRLGTMTRNIQRYFTPPDGDLVAFGDSAIGRVGAIYSQNDRHLKTYYETLEHGRLPIVRGLDLSADNLMRRAVILGLISLASHYAAPSGRRCSAAPARRSGVQRRHRNGPRLA